MVFKIHSLLIVATSATVAVETNIGLHRVCNPTRVKQLLNGPVSTQSELNRNLEEIMSIACDENGLYRPEISEQLWTKKSDYMLGGKSENDESKSYLIEFDDHPLDINDDTTIYTWNKLAFKYHKHCQDDLEPIDTNVVEYWFLHRLKTVPLLQRFIPSLILSMLEGLTFQEK